MSKTMLSRKSFDASRQFIESQARPLEIVRFRYAFEGGSVRSVIDALRIYQNDDGGFGHALEPDLRTGDSSALCTSIAFQVLRSMQISPDESMVKSAIAYLLKTLDRQNDHWRVIPVSAGQSPHAPWWDQTGREAEFNAFSLNPTAELLGYLYDYLGDTQKDGLTPIAEHVLMLLSASEKIEMYELLCCLRLLQSESLPENVERHLRQKSVQLIDVMVSLDPLQWKNYTLLPIQVVDDPASPFIAGREEAVEANLKYDICSQNTDGSWSPNWTWSDMYPEVWPIACREWTGVLTLDTLILLKRFHRIEGFD
jgi:hypothetical protein